MLLYPAGERVQVARPRMRGERLPRGKRRTRRCHRGVDVGRGAVRDAGNDFVRRWIDYVEQRARLGENAADVVPERATMTREPGERLLVALRRGAVLHRFKDLGYCGHLALGERVRRRRAETACGDGVLMASDAGGRRRIGPS